MVFISVPCKKGSEVNLVKPIEHYITGNLGAGQAAACKKGLEHLQRLRNDIILKLNDAHDSTVNLIESYCDLLKSLEHRIPLTNQDIPIAFKWYDCLGGSSKPLRSSMKGYSAGFDRCCMMFNLAACQSQIAKNQNTNDDLGLKIAAKALQVAAGMFDYVKTLLPTFYSQSPTLDMSAEALASYSIIMLAQAQECIFLKAEHDEMKPNIVAKLANQAFVFYNEALTSISLTSLKPFLPKEWFTILSIKAASMEIYAEYYSALAAEADQLYGEQISRLNKTLLLLKKASRIEGMKEFYAKVERSRDLAKKDNDLIYHDTIPDPKLLPSIGMAPVAKRLPVTSPLGAKPNKELFDTLVPIPVYNATQVADNIRRQMVTFEMGRLREATDTCNGVMTSLNLPSAVQEISDSKDVIPMSLVEKAAYIRHNGGVAALLEKISSLSDGNTRNTEIVENISSTIDEEEKTDNELREQYGNKWNRQHSSKLNAGWRAEITKHRQLLQQAGQTDKGLRDRFNTHEVSFKHLSSPESELRAYVLSEMENQDSSRAQAGDSSSKKKALRDLCDQIDTMKKERVDLQKQLEQTTLPEPLTKEFLKVCQNGGTIDAQSLATDHINAALESTRDSIRVSIDKQTSLIEKIQSLYESVFGKKKDCASALTTLLMAAETFSQLNGDVGQGINFYADLTGILVKFQNKVNDYVFARQTEKKELMKDISKDMCNEKPADAPERPPPTYMSAAKAPATAPPPIQPPPASNSNVQPMYGVAPAPGYWVGYGAQPPHGVMPPGFSQMPMYGMYGGYPMPAYNMPGLPLQPQAPTQPQPPPQ